MATKLSPRDQVKPPVKAARKRASQELAVVLPKKISKLNTKGMKSILGDSAETIQQMLEVNNNESATSLIQKRLLQSLVDLIPFAEHSIRKTKGARGVYQLNSLVTSVRELMIDLQSTRDKGAIGAELVEKVVRPAFLDIGMFLVQEDARLDNDIKDLVDLKTYRAIKEVKKESLSRMASTIQEKYGDVKAQSIAFLQS